MYIDQFYNNTLGLDIYLQAMWQSKISFSTYKINFASTANINVPRIYLRTRKVQLTGVWKLS